MSVLALGFAAVLAPVTFGELADRCISVHKKANAGAFMVDFSSTGTEQNRSGTYEVAYLRPDKLRFRVRMQQTAKTGPIDQSFILVGPTLYGVDHNSAQMLQRKVQAKGSLPERFQSAIALDEPIRVAVDATGLELFLSPMRELRRWQISLAGDTYQAIAPTPSGRFELGFSKSSGRLVSVAIRSGAAGLRWTYKGWKANPGSFKIPSGLRKVNEFYETPPLPKAADRASKELLQSVFNAYARLRHVAYKVTDGTDTISVWLSDGSARQINARGEWSWQKGTFRIAPKGAAPTSKKAKLTEVENTAGRYGMNIEPMLQRFLQGRNPLSTMWKPDLTAKIVGQVNVGTMKCTILELKSRGIRINAMIRRDTNLIHSLSTESLDRSGNVINASERRFTYSSVGRPLPSLGR